MSKEIVEELMEDVALYDNVEKDVLKQVAKIVAKIKKPPEGRDFDTMVDKILNVPGMRLESTTSRAAISVLGRRNNKLGEEN